MSLDLVPFLGMSVPAVFVVALAARRPPLEPAMRLMLGLQSGVLALLALVFVGGFPGALAAALGSALEIAVFVALMQHMYRSKQVHFPTSRLMLSVVGAGVVASLGVLLWVAEGSPWLLLASLPIQAAVVLMPVFRPPVLDDEQRFSWALRPFWSFQLLLGIFLAELFLGAALDILTFGGSYLRSIPFATLAGSSYLLPADALYNGLWFVAATCVSAWFLILIGAEMGSLVVFKIRETPEREQKWRLGLMLSVYAVAVVYLPSFFSPTPLFGNHLFANIPILGWGMGIRTGGPFAPGVLSAIILMYVSVGALTVLFGRRALCSVMCGAAMMYQATTISAMRTYNRSSWIGKRFLGSNFSTAYTVASALALVSLFATSFLPYLHLFGSVEFANGDFDANMLPFELYFGALWFVMFVSIPYVGNYNCVTTGFCHWGAFSQFFAKVGFFKLKVKDRTVCQQCTTMECAKACSVGLVDMPQYFRTKGEYRSVKCTGTGDCAIACPYGNIYLYDIRNWLRDRKGSGRPATTGPQLPVLRPTASPKSAASSVAPR
jgi:polyferredoxin